MSEHDLNTILRRLDEMERHTPRDRVWDYAFKASVPLVIALVGWVWAQEARVARLEFHAEHSPPQWLRNDIGTIKSSLRDIEQRMRHLENGKK